MQKCFVLFVTLLSVVGVGLMLPPQAAAFQMVDSSGCLQCHTVGTPGGDEGLHSGAGHTTCSNCHSGTPAKGTAAASACVACHPAEAPGKCALVNGHDPDTGASCLSCHSACASGDDDDDDDDGETNPCVAETIYGADSQEAELLRQYRDSVLSKTPAGRSMIGVYYSLEPVISRAMQRNVAVRIVIKTALDNILLVLK